MTQVLASAIVDQIRGGSVPLFEVRVWGGSKPAQSEADAEHVRTYQFERTNANLAASEGIRRFVEEIEALSEWQ